ncbi:iron ABC transporter permease [Bacteroides sp.]|uniref:iron ABC transporter permease n=1 Tax=Bacteroides sp. TaxID=29523 RepID=UPI001B71EB3C|nr:iron ABC transporter permease [Bacteroides sp.]MBP6065882.1 iron ABC transporter permease [Bacteroides sp.]MBP6067935.1 iron ABC transporter permease [Bacteroides sp.]MBP6937005.1 iron ABC transporter permease [Bacteroides sp.]MBP9508217.1 iron ABC transporter permease [Bacteroides sp.]MBP9585945.1 iron ABC transporter permease [Bacteroides sp.]
MKHKETTYSLALLIALFVLVGANLLFGSVRIPADAVWNILLGNEVEKASWSFIVWESRFPQAVTALLCGASLAGSGLMLQTAFNNPLADPSILGISSGSSLGVALVMLVGGGSLATGLFSFSGLFSIVVGAFMGAMLVMGLILFFSTLIKSNIMLLIIGIMIGYIISSVISLLNFFATAEGVHSYLIWGMGNFGGVSLQQLPYFSVFILLGLLLSVLLIKPLNAMLLGTRYAENLGVNIRRTRNLLLLATGLLTAVTTAFCGPISFIGLAVPHMARLLLGTSNHNVLLPITLLTGGVIALICNLICALPGEAGIIPLNAVTPVLGAPIIIYVIINQRKIQYFN